MAAAAKERKSISEIIAESNEARRARRRREGPPPWIIRKLAVFVVAAIIAYTCYVYIARFCVPMLRQRADALGSRATGSACLALP
jgi:palmitoyltransferase